MKYYSTAYLILAFVFNNVIQMSLKLYNKDVSQISHFYSDFTMGKECI